MICPRDANENEVPTSLAPVAKLKPAQRVAAWELACGATKTAAAVKAGVSAWTVFQWVKLPVFQQAVEEGTDLLLAFNAPAEKAASAIVAEGAPAAAHRLVDLVDSEDEAMQFRAASKVLECVGIGGGKGDVNIAVGVSVDAAHQTVQSAAERVLDAQAATDA